MPGLRPLALSIAALSLCAGCMSPARPGWRTVEAVAPIAPPPEVCAEEPPEPVPPEGAAYPEPVTPAEIRAEARLTAFLARHRAWGQEGWAVAAAARKASCADINAS